MVDVMSDERTGQTALVMEYYGAELSSTKR
jgi:hypothetical protein